MLGIKQQLLAERRTMEIWIQPPIHPQDSGDGDIELMVGSPPGEQLLGDRDAVIVGHQERVADAAGGPPRLHGVGGGVDRVAGGR